MVHLSPDMVINGAWNSGYRYNQDTIRCFSHIHAWPLSAIPVLPTTGESKGHLGSNEYGSKFSHKKETVKAAYHQVSLEDYNIDTELTATTRVGFHRYTFPVAEQSHIHVDFSTFLGPNDTEKGYTKKISAREIAGYALMGPLDAAPRLPKYTMSYNLIKILKNLVLGKMANLKKATKLRAKKRALT